MGDANPPPFSRRELPFVALEDRRPVKSFAQGIKDNPLVVGGIVVMFGIMFRGIWHAIHGRHLQSNRWAQYRSAAAITTLVLFGISAWRRDQDWNEELARRQKARAAEAASFDDAAPPSSSVKIHAAETPKPTH